MGISSTEGSGGRTTCRGGPASGMRASAATMLSTLTPLIPPVRDGTGPGLQGRIRGRRAASAPDSVPKGTATRNRVTVVPVSRHAAPGLSAGSAAPASVPMTSKEWVSARTRRQALALTSEGSWSSRSRRERRMLLLAFVCPVTSPGGRGGARMRWTPSERPRAVRCSSRSAACGRSEERRVGKECRSRRAQERRKENRAGEWSDTTDKATDAYHTERQYETSDNVRE